MGLHDKAAKINDIAPGKLATLEALIKRMPTRFKSELPKANPLYEKDERVAGLIQAILSKYPNHKRVLFLKAKYENNESLSAPEVSDLKRLTELLKIKG